MLMAKTSSFELQLSLQALAQITAVTLEKKLHDCQAKARASGKTYFSSEH
jgi:hypothetical protein